MKKLILLFLFILLSIYLDAQNIILYRRDTVGGAYGSGLVMTPNDVAVYVATHSSIVDTTKTPLIGHHATQWDLAIIRAARTTDSTAANKKLLTWTSGNSNYVPKITKINGIQLSGDINLTKTEQTFTNDSIDCSYLGGITFNSYTVASDITLKGKIANRVDQGFVVLVLVGNGTNTITLGSNMQYVDGASFNSATGKINIVTIVWFKTLSKWIVFTNAY